jgi:two-component system, chemotaxis family, response regulator Rcp1
VNKARQILIAEDNPADVRLIREALRSLEPPATIHVAQDGEQAIEFLGRCCQPESVAIAHRPRLGGLDFHLPKTDPRQVLEFVRANDALAKVAVVVFTSSAEEDLIREAYRLGANCYLVKPSDLDTFFFTIRSAAEFWLNHPFSN